MRKRYKVLTEDQKARGVVFSSELVGSGMDKIVHEVLKEDEEKELKVRRLLDDKFFNKSPYQYNLIRQ